MSQCEGPECGHSSHKDVVTETFPAIPPRPAKQKTFVDNAGRPVDPNEVRPVKPIDLVTPEQQLKKAEAALKVEQEKLCDLQEQLDEARADTKTADELANSYMRENLAKAKRIGEVAADRDAWQRRAIAAEAQPKPEHVANIVADRDRLRGEISAKDKRIAQLEKELHKVAEDARAAVSESRKIADQAKQRAEGVLATFDTMQLARDAAQRERDQLKADLVTATNACGKCSVDRDAALLEVKELQAKLAKLTPAPVRKGA